MNRQLNITVPAPLTEGARILMVAPSNHPDKLPKWALPQLEEMATEHAPGFVFSKTDRFKEKMGPLETLTPEQRAADLMRGFTDPEVDAILCTSGGVGAISVLPLLDYDIIAENPKWFLGFSDTTAVHLAIQARSGLAVGYGATVARLADKQGASFTWTNFLQAFGDKGPWSAANYPEHYGNESWDYPQGEAPLILTPPPRVLNAGVDRKVDGVISGGNLLGIVRQKGTGYLPSYAGCLLHLETSGNTTVKDIAANLHSLFMAPELEMEGVQAITLGLFQEGSKMTEEKLRYIIDTLVRMYPYLKDVPIVYGAPFCSHVAPICPLPLGILGSLEIRSGSPARPVEYIVNGLDCYADKA